MSTIDPKQVLTFSIAANPGVYALLLGSGVSRSAGIPTGWEIVQNLLAKLAASADEAVDIALEDWYREKYLCEPEYSALLDALAREPAERQILLRPYFEPTDNERDQGLKQPTAAHKAIARMVVDGLIRVIITTNFDRLTETALREVGVEPTVLSSPDQVAGALPLIHMGCCVFKVHGDYLDPRILNSPTELMKYDKAVDRLLDQIIDEFGLIVCGWSADWDVALRNAIARAPSRRFTTFWASRGNPGSEANNLIDQRSAQLVHIEDADSFFTEIQAAVSSIIEFSRSHPLSIEAAVETLKRYMVSREDRIRHADHIDGVVRDLVNATTTNAFQVGGTVSQDTFAQRIQHYESVCSTLIAMGVVAGYWAEDEHLQDWERAIRRLCKTDQGSGSETWTALRNYPALLLMYSLGLGAVASGRLAFLGDLLDIFVERRLMGIDRSRVLQGLVLDLSSIPWNDLLPGKERHPTPLNDRLHDVFQEPCGRVILSEDYSRIFDKLEILLALHVTHNNLMPFGGTHIGSFLHRQENLQRTLLEIQVSLDMTADESPFVRCEIFGSTARECLETIEVFKNFVGNVVRHRGIW